MPSWESWVERPVDLIKVGGRAKALKLVLLGCQMEFENVSLTVNICNEFKSLQIPL